MKYSFVQSLLSRLNLHIDQGSFWGSQHVRYLIFNIFTKLIQRGSTNIFFFNPKELAADNLRFTSSEGTSISNSSSSKISSEKSEKRALDHIGDNSRSARKNSPVAPTQDASDSTQSSPAWNRDRFKGSPKTERPVSKPEENQFGSAKSTNNKDRRSCTNKDIIFKKEGNYSFVMCQPFPYWRIPFTLSMLFETSRSN